MFILQLKAINAQTRKPGNSEVGLQSTEFPATTFDKLQKLNIV